MKEIFKLGFSDSSCCFSHLLGMSVNSPPLPLSFFESLLTSSWAGPGVPLFD